MTRERPLLRGTASRTRFLSWGNIPALTATALLAGGWNAAHSSGSAPVLTYEGYGAVRFGMTVEEAERALGTTAGTDRSGSQACRYTSFTRYAHAKFMVEDGHITRIELDARGRNILGIAVGMPLAEVRQRHPEVTIRPHKYDEAGHYLVFAPASGKAEIVAEESRGRVTLIRGGLLPAVEYVEGCQ